MNVWFAALAAAAAGWLWFPAGGGGLARLADPGISAPVKRGRRAGGVRLAAVALPPLLGGLLGGGRGVALGLVASLVGGTVAGLWGRHRERAARLARRTAVVEAGQLVAGLLRVGRVPAQALVEAAGEVAVLAVAAAELRAGGDAAAALRRQAEVPGQEGLRGLAAAWEVAAVTGASLCDAVDAAADALAADAEVARVVAAELSASRAAGRIMALLPAAGLVLGYAFGGDPIAFLLASPIGWGCLVIGTGFACAGVWWIEWVAGRSGGQ